MAFWLQPTLLTEMARQHSLSIVPVLGPKLTNSWEAFHDQFCPMALGKLIPRSDEDSVDRLLSVLNFLDEALLII